MKTLLISTACVLIVLVIHTEASLFRGLLKIDENGSYCEGPQQTRMEVGEDKRIDCFDCSCSEYGLSCQGVGYNAGTMYVEGCSKKNLDNCCYQFFKDDKPSESCTSLMCP